MGRGQGIIVDGGGGRRQRTNKYVAKQPGVCAMPTPDRQGDLQYDVGMVVAATSGVGSR